MNALRRIAPLLLALLVVTQAVQAEVRLSARRGEDPVPVAGLTGWQSGMDKLHFELSGELSEFDDLAYWWPEYALRRSNAEELDRNPERMARLSVSLQSIDLIDTSGKPKPSELGQIWPGAAAKESVVFVAWVLDGRLSHVTPMRPHLRNDRDIFSLSAMVTLELDEMRGYPVLLLWRDGHFVKASAARIPAGQVAAFRAVVKDDAATLGQLLASGLKGNERDTAKRSLGEHAAMAGAVRCLELLKARKGSFNTLAKQDNSALELAAARGRSAAVRVLLESGVDPDCRDQMQESPLYHAAVGGHLETVEALLAKKVRVDELTRGNLTATVAALNEGQLVVAGRLLRERVEFDFSSENTQLVFLSLCHDGKLGQTRFYMERGCSASKAVQGRYPLIEGAYKGTSALAEMLVKAGASPNVADAEGNTPLLIACVSGNVGYARALLAAGAKVAVQNKSGHTPLHSAIFRQKYELVRELLAAGAPTDTKNKHGLTPFDFAVLIGAWDCIDPFVKAGAKLDPRFRHITLEVEALLRGDQAELLAQLLQSGLPADFKGTGGWPLRRLAHLAKATRCSALLEEAGMRLDESVPDSLVRGGGIDPGFKFLSGRDPQDPRPEMLAGKGATLKLRVLVDSKGQACFTLIDECVDPLLCLSLVDTVDTWRFTPPTKGGKPVALWVEREIKFLSAKEQRAARPVPDQMPQVVRQEKPEYPHSARRRGQMAEVVLAFVVDEKGAVTQARVVRTSGLEFNEPALECVRKWKFKPAKAKGVPVAIELQVPIIFAIQN